MEIFNKIFDWYSKVFNFIPEKLRIILAIVIVAILVISIFKFLRKNFIWIIVIILLLPFTWPALKQIWEKLLVLVSK